MKLGMSSEQGSCQLGTMVTMATLNAGKKCRISGGQTQGTKQGGTDVTMSGEEPRPVDHPDRRVRVVRARPAHALAQPMLGHAYVHTFRPARACTCLYARKDLPQSPLRKNLGYRYVHTGTHT